MERYYETNRRRWDELVGIHAASEEYDLQGFLDGESSLHSLELEALGNVSGRSLLQLQCHFGLDTLSWGRLGARVTGVDFSDTAIELIESGQIKAAELATHRFPLEEAEQAFDVAKSKAGCKVLFIP